MILQFMRSQATRILVGIVLGSNLLCAVLFLWQPEAFTPGFELTGEIGMAMVRGMGVLFLMWNVPYAVAFINPARHRTALLEALAMQSIGVTGEGLILASLSPIHAVARQSLVRFIAFDLLGLIVLLLATWLARRINPPNSRELYPRNRKAPG